MVICRRLIESDQPPNCETVGGSQNNSGTRVRVLVFEYGSLWQNRTLKGEVEALDAWGYDCYLLQQLLVVRLTGCWVPAMEGRYWSNALCVLRSEHALHAAVEAFTLD